MSEISNSKFFFGSISFELRRLVAGGLVIMMDTAWFSGWKMVNDPWFVDHEKADDHQLYLVMAINVTASDRWFLTSPTILTGWEFKRPPINVDVIVIHTAITMMFHSVVIEGFKARKTFPVHPEPMDVPFQDGREQYKQQRVNNHGKHGISSSFKGDRKEQRLNMNHVLLVLAAVVLSLRVLLIRDAGLLRDFLCFVLGWFLHFVMISCTN